VPVDGYTKNDGCLERGELNDQFIDDGKNPKKHVADDYCGQMPFHRIDDNRNRMKC
jgi:hypothetical protein